MIVYAIRIHSKEFDFCFYIHTLNIIQKYLQNPEEIYRL